MTWFRRSAHPEEDLSAYVDGELGERARRAVETHLANCEACSTLLKELEDAKSLLSELPRPEPRRSLALGPEFAVERRAAPAPRRMSFTFAPAVALSVLVALLFVDAINSGGGFSNDQAFSTSGSTAASRAVEEPAAGGGLAPESATKADEANSTLGAADSSTTQDGSDAGGAAAGAAELAPPTQSLESAAPNAAAAAEAPPTEDSSAAIPESTPEAGEAPAPLASVPAGERDDSATDTTAAVPQEPPRTSQPEDANGSSGGLSTLRILEIIAALAFVASLTAVFLPRMVGREER